MKITFETWNQNPGVDKMLTSQETPFFYKGQERGAYALDISGTVMDNNAYGDHGRSAKDVMQSFDAQPDISVQRDYMTVMSNILSTEDFNKMMEEGFDPSKLNPEQVVTIVDHIKAEMAKSGQVIEGYNDDLKPEQLKEIVGDPGLAKEIEQALKNANLPVNEENVTSIKDSLDKALSVKHFDEASKKYMVENYLEPTVENIYRAGFSALGDGNRQSRGYYAQELPGYFAKKADNIDWNAINLQLESAIRKMNLPGQTMEDSLNAAKWLVEKGIPVTEESMTTLGEIEAVSIPLDKTTVISAAVNSLLKGRGASEGNLTDATETIYQKAIRYSEEVRAVTEDAVKETVNRGENVTLYALYETQKQLNAGSISTNTAVDNTQEKYVTASRQLAEVQLRMTIDANIRLLKSDYAIDTAPLSELVDLLKQQEQKLAAQFFGNANSDEISAKADLFIRTRNTLQELPSMPAAVIGRITYEKSVSLSVVYEQGSRLRAEYDKAGASYEALMTAPRADMGDSIKKAFRNTDDILRDMGLKLTEDNRKAVRILGYNSMEINEEAVNKVKDAYLQVEDIIKGMTPQKTLSLIRDGINPLNMELNELEGYLKSMDDTPGEELTKYSRYLYELEKNRQITEGEREAYIGVYRLFRQIEKTDGAAIGSLLSQGSNLTLGNLLTAVRNKKVGHMDYSVDDSFGVLEEKIEKGKSISGQIERGVREARTAHAVYRDISADALVKMSVNEQTTLEELRDGFSQENIKSMREELTEELSKEQRQYFKQVAETDGNILNTLKQYGIEFTAENLLALKSLLTGRGQLARTAKETAEKLDLQNPQVRQQASITDTSNNIIENFTGYEAAQEAMERWENCISETFQKAVSELPYSSDEVKSMYMNYKQLSVMNTLRKAEKYEIPMEIDGEMTSVNLTLMRDDKQKGTVSITMDIKVIGKAGVKFKLSENRIDSFFAADSEAGKERLAAAGERILDNLQKEGFEIGETHYVNAHSQGRKEWNLLTFSEQNVDNSNETVATTQLYNTAKIFLRGIREYI